MEYNNHLKLGSTERTHKGRKVATSMASDSFEEGIRNIRSISFRVGVIPPGFEHRADLIADLFYGSASLDWIVLWSNNISDPFQQLNVGDRLKIVNLI